MTTRNEQDKMVYRINYQYISEKGFVRTSAIALIALSEEDAKTEALQRLEGTKHHNPRITSVTKY